MNIELGKKQIIQITVAIVLLGLLIFSVDLITCKTGFDRTVARNNPGEGEKCEEYSISFDGKKENIKVSVSERELNVDEIENALNEAKQEIKETYLGKNVSANNVCYDLDVRKTYAKGLITATWQFSDYSIINMDGELNHGNISEAGNPVDAKIELSYKETTKVFSLSFVVKPMDTSTDEGRKYAIEKAIATANDTNPIGKKIKLPEKINGESIKWSRRINYRGLELSLLGLLMAFSICIAKKMDKKKQKAVLQSEKEKDYPLIVSELSILMSAGMSLRKAMERICTSYIQKKKKNPQYKRAGYEEILYTYRQMEEGVGEMTALENMSLRCEHKDYRKLSLLLMQNLKKGSSDLIYALEKEEALAFEMRKQRAVRLGEEASTKMLLPLGGMLMIVIVILIVPALMQIN